MPPKGSVIDEEDLSLKFQKKTQHQHILDLPDTYLGSNQIEKGSYYVYDDEDQKIIQKDIKIVPGLKNIIEEIMVNAFDNYSRINQKNATIKGKKLESLTTIKVNLDQDLGEISIYNDGEGIDVAIHPTEDIYIPQMIFGELLTSGNYNKNEQKITGGKNGYGAKLTNIYSTSFIVETVDKKRKLFYQQKFSNNMYSKEDPIIKNLKGHNIKSYTKITFIPDYKRFGIEGLSDDLCSLIKKRTYDMVACSSGSIEVYYNDIQTEVCSFNDYINLYIQDNERITLKINDRWEIGACLTPSFNFKQISFVNGINTSRGGRHVDYISKQICQQMVDLIKRKKKVEVKEHIIKDNLMIFVNSTIVNPSFDSQTKETLTTTRSKFGSECILPSKFIDGLSTCGIMERAVQLSEFRDKQLLSKTDGRKIKRLLDIEKLEDAKYAGTKNGAKCTLILTEGDSAKAMAVAGISVIPNGRDYYGIFPLRGKLLNTRDKKERDIANNKEVTYIKRIMGLQEGRVYKNISELRYGRIMIMTDQDVDGSHIKGLIINFLSKWQSLMNINGFITSLLTPIIKVKKGTQTINFYTIHDYNEWLKKNLLNWTTKYYKGLGTSTPAEAKDYFRDFKVIEYHWSEDSDLTIDMAFNKERSDDRKAWLDSFSINNILDLNQTHMTFSDFINKELIHFSNADNYRSIPSLLDGFKPSLRKILYCAEKRNLVKEIRVAQLAGYVSEHGAYHHGEASLHGTIIGMAHNFVGSNNINLLEPNGQFGSRLKGGKDSAQPRYIHTQLCSITSKLFNKLDNPIYKYVDDDGNKVEPIFYMPILPMILVNGTEGIGTGWSSGIPKFDPIDIIKNIRRMMNSESIKEMIPYFRGFYGKVEKLSPNHWITKGVYKLEGQDTVVITELPVGMWTDNFKVLLDSLSERGDIPAKKKESQTSSKGRRKAHTDPIIKDYKNESTESKIKFILKFEKKILNNLLTKHDKTNYTKLEHTLKLTSKISCDKKLNLYDENGVMIHFRSINDIFYHYYRVRLEFYDKRKEYLLSKLENEFALANIKMKFILDIINNNIKINNIPKNEIIKQLERKNYPKMIDHLIIELDKLSTSQVSKASYDFLIKMPIYNLTKEKIEELSKEKENIEFKLTSLRNKTVEDLWNDDLIDFEKHYKGFMKNFYDYNDFDEKDFRIKVKQGKMQIKA